MRSCKFLSKPLNINPGNVDECLDKQFEKFKQDFIINTTYFKGKPIIVEKTKDDNDYGELLNEDKYRLTSFAHIVSRKVNKNSKKRELNIKRLQSCGWVKELIDIFNNMGSNCYNCQYFIARDIKEHGQDVTYIYCTTVRYVVILGHAYNNKLPKTDEKYEYHFIKTAFYVDELSMHLYIKNKF